jgi:hypothetical protein
MMWRYAASGRGKLMLQVNLITVLDANAVITGRIIQTCKASEKTIILRYHFSPAESGSGRKHCRPARKCNIPWTCVSGSPQIFSGNSLTGAPAAQLLEVTQYIDFSRAIICRGSMLSVYFFDLRATNC